MHMCFVLQGKTFAEFGPKTWSEASSDCKSRGGNLAVPENEEENESIRKVLSLSRAWIGVDDRQVRSIRLSRSHFVQNRSNFPRFCVCLERRDICEIRWNTYLIC